MSHQQVGAVTFWIEWHPRCAVVSASPDASRYWLDCMDLTQTSLGRASKAIERNCAVIHTKGDGLKILHSTPNFQLKVTPHWRWCFINLSIMPAWPPQVAPCPQPAVWHQVVEGSSVVQCTGGGKKDPRTMTSLLSKSLKLIVITLLVMKLFQIMKVLFS